MSPLLQPYQDKIRRYAYGKLMDLEIPVPDVDRVKDMLRDIRECLSSAGQPGIWAARVKRHKDWFLVFRRRAA